MELDLIDTAAVRARRERLVGKLGGEPALVMAGAPRPRNYAALTYPYRASSHFLYFVGVGVPQAALLLDGARPTLFVEPHTSADELWHGPVPSEDDLAAATGCEVRPLKELPDVVKGRDVATVPAVDLGTLQMQQKMLKRSLDTLESQDEALVDAIIALRLEHDDAALKELRLAAEATDAVHRAGMLASTPGVKEHVVRAAMEHEALARGMVLAYRPIVTVHGEVLHNESYHRDLSDADLLLADVGAESPGGWACDVTRTWPVAGELSATQRAVYEVVLAAQERAIAKVAPGVRYRDVHLEAARALTEGLVELEILVGDVDELVADGVHALFFPHGVGHLLGLDVHDMEDLGDRAGYAPGRKRSEQFGLSYLRLDRDLAPGMAVTIEPGFYQVPAILADEALTAVAKDRLNRAALSKFEDVRGIRIEDDVLVTEDGNEVLTASIPKTAEAIEEACA